VCICVLFYCSFAYSHRNAFGRNQKLNVSLERGQVDSMFRINYTDPWIEGDDKRTSRAINIQVCAELFKYTMECSRVSMV
jgi:outer membrane protein assembly factor BamA